MGTKMEIAVSRPKDADSKKLDALLRKSQAGDGKALREMVDLYGDREEFWLQVGDYAGMVQKRILESQVGSNLLLREGIERRLQSMRLELAGPEPSPLERMLVERVVACWLQVHAAEMQFNRGGISFEQAEHDQRVIDRAHRRHLSAIKTLAVVRRLHLPAMQVNIAERQVNVAGGPVPLRDCSERSSA